MPKHPILAPALLALALPAGAGVVIRTGSGQALPPVLDLPTGLPLVLTFQGGAAGPVPPEIRLRPVGGSGDLEARFFSFQDVGGGRWELTLLPACQGLQLELSARQADAVSEPVVLRVGPQHRPEQAPTAPTPAENPGREGAPEGGLADPRIDFTRALPLDTVALIASCEPRGVAAVNRTGRRAARLNQSRLRLCGPVTGPDLVATLAERPRLRHLSLGYLPQVTPAALEAALRPLSGLVSIRIQEDNNCFRPSHWPMLAAGNPGLRSLAAPARLLTPEALAPLQGRLTSLELKGPCAPGGNHAWLRHCPALTCLRAAYCMGLGDLDLPPGLTRLAVIGCHDLTGSTLPADLRDLVAIRCSAFDPSLAGMAHLRRLEVIHCPALRTGQILELMALGRLADLSLSPQALPPQDPSRPWPSLTHLWVTGGSDTLDLRAFPNLTSLEVIGDPENNALVRLELAEGLRRLVVANCPKFRCTGLPASLRELRLANGPANLEAQVLPPTLTRLELTGPSRFLDVLGWVPQSLVLPTSLKEVMILGMGYASMGGIYDLLSRLPGLEWLDVTCDTLIGSVQPGRFDAHPALRELWVSMGSRQAPIRWTRAQAPESAPR